MIKRTFTLKQISQITGISANRLRIWKKRYGILDPVSSEGKAHFYSSDTLKYLMRVVKLLDQGHRISDVIKMSEEEMSDRLEAVFQQRGSQQLQLIKDELLQAVLDLDSNEIQRIYGKSLERFGFKDTIEDLFFPLLNFLGSLWENGTIHTIQEHLLTQFIRQKLTVALDRMSADSQKPEITLFLPDQELHELSLLYFHYTLLDRAFNSTFLGASVPYEDIKDYIAMRNPSYVITYVRYTGNLDFHLQSLPEVIHQFPETQFHFVTASNHIKKVRKLTNGEELPNLHLYGQMEELCEKIISLASEHK